MDAGKENAGDKEFSLREFFQENFTLSGHCDNKPSSFPRVISRAALKMVAFSHKRKSARVWSHGSNILWLN